MHASPSSQLASVRRLAPVLVLSLALAAAACGCAPALAHAQQASACLPTTDTLATDLLKDIQYLADPNLTGESKASRDSLGIPAVWPYQITFVTDKTTCRRAADAYKANVATGAASPPSGRVYVVQAGQTYSVIDPGYHYRQATDVTIMTFNSSWTLLSKHF